MESIRTIIDTESDAKEIESVKHDISQASEEFVMRFIKQAFIKSTYVLDDYEIQSIDQSTQENEVLSGDATVWVENEMDPVRVQYELFHASTENLNYYHTLEVGIIPK